jgi:hypothetical protein
MLTGGIGHSVQEPDLKPAGTAVLLAVLLIGGKADPAPISSAEGR